MSAVCVAYYRSRGFVADKRESPFFCVGVTLKLFNLVQTFSVGTNETFIATILTTFEFAEFDV